MVAAGVGGVGFGIDVGVPLDFQGVQLAHDPDGRPLGRAVEVAFESGYADSVLVSDAKAVEHLAD